MFISATDWVIIDFVDFLLFMRKRANILEFVKKKLFNFCLPERVNMKITTSYAQVKIVP